MRFTDGLLTTWAPGKKNNTLFSFLSLVFSEGPTRPCPSWPLLKTEAPFHPYGCRKHPFRVSLEPCHTCHCGTKFVLDWIVYSCVLWGQAWHIPRDWARVLQIGLGIRTEIHTPLFLCKWCVQVLSGGHNSSAFSNVSSAGLLFHPFWTHAEITQLDTHVSTLYNVDHLQPTHVWHSDLIRGLTERTLVLGMNLCGQSVFTWCACNYTWEWKRPILSFSLMHQHSIPLYSHLIWVHERQLPPKHCSQQAVTEKKC